VSENHSTADSQSIRPGDPTLTSGQGFGGALELPAGTIIAERYKVIEEIGRGGMGVVYRVLQLTLDREMALKTIDGHDVKDATWRRFQQEAKASSLLDHPNLISVHDSGVIEGKHPYFVMDYVQGTTLSKLVEEKGPLTVEEALPIFIQVCFGLAYAHDLGIVHRDLKPSNIMLMKPPGGGAYIVKIVDFGIAKLHQAEGADIQGLTKTGEIFGSPLYMSPEQCLGIAVDHRSDIYALGCVFFEALAGLPPFMGNTALATMMQHQSERPPSLKEATLGKEFPQPVEALIARLLEKDPDKRYQSLKAVARDLSLLQQGVSGQALTQVDSLSTEHKGEVAKATYFQTLVACIATALVTGIGVWIIKDHLDADSYSKQLEKEIAAYKRENYELSRYTAVDTTVQSSTVLGKDGRKMRRILFMRPIGQIAIAKTREFKKAKGICEIPVEQSLHLQIIDPDVPTAPNFFLQFQPDDITELSMNANEGVTDRTLQNLSHLSSLTYLAIPYTDISDAAIKYINQLPKLEALFIGQNPITENALLTLKRLNQFTSLGIGRLPSVHKILERLKSSKHLLVLQADQCNLNTSDIQAISEMKNLIELSIADNDKVNDKDFRLLTSLKKMQRFDISHTTFTAGILPLLKEFPDLHTVQISQQMWSQKDIERAKSMYPKITFKIYIKHREQLRADAKDFTPPDGITKTK
jgi:predicted Ser/Thr protein kinase